MSLPRVSLVLPIVIGGGMRIIAGYTKPSIVWQLSDEYEAFECLKNWWERGLIQQLHTDSDT
jgi:hypothetical protein